MNLQRPTAYCYPAFQFTICEDENATDEALGVITRVSDPFADIMKYLLQSFERVPNLYQMDKTARWDANNKYAESKKFVAERLAAGSQMLANLWYTAWLGSMSARPDVR